MLNNKIQKKIVKLMELALKVNSKKKNTVFINFFGHCESIDVQVYKNGWKYEKEADYKKYIHFLSSSDTSLRKESEKALDETILEIEELI